LKGDLMKLSTVGKILGAFGLVALLSSPFTLFFTAHSLTLAIAKAVFGVVMIGVFFFTNYGELGQFASRKSTFFFGSSLLLGVLALALLSTVNYVAAKKGKSWDLTRNKLFTLAPQTDSTLKGLKDKVTAIGFLPANHPAYEELEALFQRYHHIAPEKFDYTFKDPMKNPDLAAKYQLKQGEVTVVLTRGAGTSETHTTLSVVSEQELTNALIKLNGVGEQKVYFLAGHGEWTLTPAGASEDELATSLAELNKTLQQEGYSPTTFNLAGQKEVPRDASLVVIAGAKSPISAPEVKALESYLDQGGRVAVFAESQTETGLDKLLAKYGVELDKGVIADDRFAVGSPYLILSNFYADHEITRLLKELQMNVEIPTARGLTVLRQGLAEGVKVDPVVLTSPFAWEESTPDDNPSRSDGEKSGQIPVVVAATRAVDASAKDKRFDQARLVVFGDSELLVNANWGNEPNRNLVMNAIGWASNQVAKITIRPPEPDLSTVEIDPELMSKMRFASTDLFPLTLLGLGLAIWLKRRNQ
jgi:ABC-type uncharacterized transport system involved in gliding motility auxiliary subunit